MARTTKTYTRKSPPSQIRIGEDASSGSSTAQETTLAASNAAPIVPQANADAGANVQAEGRAAMPAARLKEYRQIEEGVQYVPAAKPPTLIEILPAEYQTTRPPLLYRLSTVSEPSRTDGRIGESRTYRARAFSCGVFYKPISRCLVDWEDK